MAQGSLYTLDTLKSNFQGIVDFGVERLKDAIVAYLDAHNEIMMSLFEDLVERTTETDRIYGSADVMTMTKTDEFGRPNAQKIGYGSKVGFPLESFQGALQWTRKYTDTATVSEIANQFIALRAADARRVTYEVQRALFNPTNYDWQEPLGNRRSLVPIKVRALVNADSELMPPGPNGEIFDPSIHTHYLGTGSFVQADFVSLLETVLEHFNKGVVQIYINRAQEATVKTFADFIPLVYQNIVTATTRDVYESPRLNEIQLFNRDIGLFHGALVTVKPWMPANYCVCFIRNQPKPLAYRTRSNSSGNLEIVWEDERYPLRAELYEREFGVGGANRVGAAVLYTANSTYAAPSIAF